MFILHDKTALQMSSSQANKKYNSCVDKCDKRPTCNGPMDCRIASLGYRPETATEMTMLKSCIQKCLAKYNHDLEMLKKNNK